MALSPPPPNIRTGPERVLEPNVRWGRGASALRIIHPLGLRRKLNFLSPMDSTKAVARRTLHMSVCMTASQYYALATSPLGEPIAQVVRYGPLETHRLERDVQVSCLRGVRGGCLHEGEEEDSSELRHG